MTGDTMGPALFVVLLMASPVLAAGDGPVTAAPDHAAMKAQEQQLQRELARLWRDSNEAAKVDMDYWVYRQQEACLEASGDGAPAHQGAGLAYETCVLATLIDQRTRLLRHRDCAQTTAFSCQLEDGRQAKMCIAQRPSPRVSLHIDDGQQVQQWSLPMLGAQASGPWRGFGRGVYGNIFFAAGQQRMQGWLRYDRLGGGPFEPGAYSAGIDITPMDAGSDGTQPHSQTVVCREQVPTTYIAWPEVVAEQFEQAGLCYDNEQDRWQAQCP